MNAIARQELFNVYVHSSPDYPGYPEGSVFHGYELKHRVEAKWMDLTPAMFVLIRAAVHNPANAFFVLLSESCLPLYPARAFYLQVIHSRQSRINGGCEDVPMFGQHDVPQRRMRRLLWQDTDEEHEWQMWKSHQWWLLTRPHAHLASLHPHTDLLELPDELYIPTLLRTHGRANETTCDWQGPTYGNWTYQADDPESWGWHPATYHSLDAGQLARMRQSTPRWDVACDWAGALAAVPGRFMSLAHWEWGEVPPEFTPMPPSCPLLARKFAPEATDSMMAALWPQRPATPPVHEVVHERRAGVDGADS
ncbi:hypothetical protein WJX81_006802 [Elliptochloris bilobata]|uniref:Uncharacterized protein n=1 Tax=Elliptochloris bilobata TaxID=381761 RepID=A0AAW1RN04_9CHLO